MEELTIVTDQLTLSSPEVAEMVGKKHFHLMRDIAGYKEVLEENPKLDSHQFFMESTYVNAQNKIQPCYQVTKKGCELIAHKMTGQKGILFSVTYIERFHEMEERIQKQQISTDPMSILKLTFEALEGQGQEIQYIKNDVKDLRENVPLFTVECEEISRVVKRNGVTLLGGKHANAYRDRGLRGKVYRDMYNQLYREFGVSGHKAIKRCHLAFALKIIKAYELPIVLSEEIDFINLQMNFEEM
ncbi:ORF6C domain-containing protein [Bacillus sp. C30]|uniref:Rha family transcriptional regulator n=1 Tax=Bacillus sp. C30 TaxID=1387733 RepID=UPI00349F672C